MRIRASGLVLFSTGMPQWWCSTKDSVTWTDLLVPHQHPWGSRDTWQIYRSTQSPASLFNRGSHAQKVEVELCFLGHITAAHSLIGRDLIRKLPPNRSHTPFLEGNKSSHSGPHCFGKNRSLLPVTHPAWLNQDPLLKAHDLFLKSQVNSWDADYCLFL